ncbi:MAG: DoxX family protein [Flammeovirgaceae bacterium]|nr:DoxX family protein [Flammeovirgaceae bacterium]
MKNKVIYWIFTGLLSLMLLMQSYMFIFNSDAVAEIFTRLSMPHWLIIPLGIAKFLAVVAILTKKSAMLKNLAYYGLGLDFLAAIASHVRVGDDGWMTASVAIVLLIGSFIYDKKLFSVG